MLQIFGTITRNGEKEERNSSQSQRIFTSRYAATCVTLMAISSKSGKAKVVDLSAYSKNRASVPSFSLYQACQVVWSSLPFPFFVPVVARNAMDSKCYYAGLESKYPSEIILKMASYFSMQLGILIAFTFNFSESQSLELGRRRCRCKWSELIRSAMI